jgi:queuine tRNA-ribosyltransferase
MGFDGYAIGGLSIGEPKQATFDITEQVVSLLPADKPRYLMGVGAPEDIVECVSRGVDIFDCALPTRVARNGGLYTRAGRVDILNAAFSEQAGPIEDGCDCYACTHFSAAYLNHLFRSRELLAYRLATIHNLAFMGRLVREVRQAVLSDTLDSFRASFLAGYRTTDEATRLSQKRKWLESRATGEAEDA